MDFIDNMSDVGRTGPFWMKIAATENVIIFYIIIFESYEWKSKYLWTVYSAFTVTLRIFPLNMFSNFVSGVQRLGDFLPNNVSFVKSLKLIYFLECIIWLGSPVPIFTQDWDKFSIELW